MAHVKGDRILETSTTTGTGAFTLAGAVSGYRAFSAIPGIVASDTVYYVIEHTTANEWEVGIGTWTAGTLTRTTVQHSTNSDSLVNFSAGTKNVFNSPTADSSLLFLPDSSFEIPGITDEPIAPVSGRLKFYSKNIASRMMPKWIGPSGVDLIIQPHIGTNGIRGIFTGTGATVGVFPSNVANPAIVSFGMTISTGLVSTGGTFAQGVLASTNLRTQTKRTTMTTGATSGAGVYIKGDQTECWRGNAAGLGGFFMIARWGMLTLAPTTRVFIGLRDVVTAPTNIDYRTSTTPGKIGMAISANTGNWGLCHNVSGGAVTVIDLGGSFPASGTDLYELVLFSAPNSASVGYRVMNLTTGATTSGTISSGLPANTTFLSPLVHINNNAATTTVMEFNKLYLETDY